MCLNSVCLLSVNVNATENGNIGDVEDNLKSNQPIGLVNRLIKCTNPTHKKPILYIMLRS